MSRATTCSVAARAVAGAATASNANRHLTAHVGVTVMPQQRLRVGQVAPSQRPARLPQCRLRMGSKLDSASPRISAALSGYAYAYRSAWRFS
jgi:hypothetical protein